ncbi:hypothetical protein SAMN02910447_01560 [Ruminococcus sp. YE71]|uniref:hypothetical protein n=1 Tax=unclassified Ruminococcus TaxID=2608920 RepID=UPI0008885343|nr:MULTISPECIES: hypothetical protein [unclassified Ruminococcus]SDA18314.1 hypothetical protein SAMN02910446_01412 [Ruminococcus sp. YE78]SFW30122.1 hypothetical protein SAMN02910447_01560 [Ruminococcus sp. YE71]
MKKNKYKVIENPLSGYDFSFRRCHAAEIGAYIIGITLFILICAFAVFSEDDGHSWNNLCENLLYPLSFSIPLFLLGLSMTFRIRRVKRIIANGKQVDGEIVSYRRTHINYAIGSRAPRKPNHTILTIRFNDNGDQECTVGAGHKLPEKALSSPYCTVYILDDNVFVTGFSLRKKGDPQISFKLEE